MPLSWNEIKNRAVIFAQEWKDESSEDAEAKSFYDGFFNVFGIHRRRVATFEKNVHTLENKQGFIDLLWKGLILVEHKSRGKDLDRAYKQAKDYFPGLKEEELPKYILVSDFEQFRLYDLEENTQHEFKLQELVNHVHLFGFIAGYQKRVYKEEDPVNIKAAEHMGKLHDKLKEIGYSGHHLEIYLVRLLFCLFADDTSIFQKDIFQDYIETKTNIDGSDLAPHLVSLFDTLNKPEDKRFKNQDESQTAFPYVNGKLFEENLPPASFDSEMRRNLLDCCTLDWGRISPAIFGALFQSIMSPELRRNLGAHYTSEKNILKLIKPLFLDDLWKEFHKVKSSPKKLEEFHNKLAGLRFLDPACGCGNFLVITYREIRLLELEVLRVLLKKHIDVDGDTQRIITSKEIFKIDVDSFYGIECEEFPARIAEVAMWLMDHQMNMIISEEFGEYYTRLPLKKSANITIGNALRIDWNTLIPKTELSYILGNPPFVGKHLMSQEQNDDMDLVFKSVDGHGVLDYVTAWYLKASEYIKDTTIRCAFVSTNSITQGEQVSILWNELFNKYNIKIHFAHKTFKWSNEAKGVAGVYVVIIGFSNFDIPEKYLYEYDTPKSNPQELKVPNITPYLTSGSDIIIMKRSEPLCEIPEITFGSKPVDGGNLIFDDDEKKELLKKEPGAKKYIKPMISGKEYLNNENRWCLWLVDANPSELAQLPEVMKRIQLVKEFRAASKKEQTREASKYPSLFAELRQPKSNFILVPLTTSENRKYIPLDFFSKDYIVNNTISFIPNATPYHFGVLSSEMHMVWVRYVCGRLESRYRYSNVLVYNTFPWPENPSEKNVKQVEVKAQAVLDIRNEFKDSSLADLYDPLTMPPKLVKAHQELDKAVDLCYRSNPFVNDSARIEYLFGLYAKYDNKLIPDGSPKKKRIKQIS